MAKLKIVKYGDEILRKTCRPVDAITPRILTLLDDMVDTMHAADGCGLAAPQVGILRRIAVVEVEPGEIYEMINPKIIARAGTQEESEGCLSLPGKWGITKRPQCVTVRALDREGNEFELTGYDLLAKAICHEVDHLDGVIYTDKVVRMLSREEVEMDD